MTRAALIVLLALICAALPAAAQQRQAPSTLLWETTYEAVSALPDAVVNDQQDAIQVVLQATVEIYFFTKPHHPAYPAIVRRQIVDNAGTMEIHTEIWNTDNEAAAENLQRHFALQDAEIERRLNEIEE